MAFNVAMMAPRHNDESPALLAILKQYFGFGSFRPLQEEIIREALGGRDVFALLPTGGGKSLCYQLPALARPGLCVVVSPLIALMKDQVDMLQSSGVPATFLNSSLTADESRARLRGLHQGAYRLLYVAPERLLLDGFLEDVRRWQVHLFAIDEAHCVSEWGHDFRPEYRQLAQLRQQFPQTPVMALTATATTRVREDIVQQLNLRSPKCFVASFNRPNLTYRVQPKSEPIQQILAHVRERPQEAGIVYCQARKTAEKLAQQLNENGVSARAYHAGLTPSERSLHQELFLRDEVRVICATIAFGMGINKPNVRFVIHFDLPKNIESYYQETGRAGRDGLPSECLLLFNAADAVKQARFIEEKATQQEQQIAREQLSQMVHYAEAADCRRATLLKYFGEDSSETDCGGCDNCLSPRATYDGTVAAQKLLSCVYRIHERSGFNVGLSHVVEVLTGADTEKIRRWNHQTLSTYGIGREQDRREWGATGRELIRLGFLRQNVEKFNVVELTEAGLTALKRRLPITLTKPMVAPKRPEQRTGAIECDEALFDILRQLRKRLADERSVPPYVVFSDVSLRQMARHYPQRETEFARISGVGEHKLREYGPVFMGEIERHLQNHPRQVFTESPAVKPERRSKVLTDTVRDTLNRFRSGQGVEEIARQRGLVSSTIYGHLATAIDAGEAIDLHLLFSDEQMQAMSQAFQRCGTNNIMGALESLGPGYQSGMLRVLRASQAANVPHAAGQAVHPTASA